MDLLTGYAAFDWVATWANPTLDVIFRIITDLGSHALYFVVCAPLFWVVDRRRASTLFLMVLVSALLNTFAKLGFDTPRPDPELARVVDLRPFQTGNPSFPSGHTQGALVFWACVAMWAQRRWVTGLAVAMTFLVAFSRVYLGAHFPIDILGGLVIGAVTLFAGSKPVDGWAHRDFRDGTPLVVTTIAVSFLTTLMTRDPSMALLTGCLLGFFIGAVWLPQQPLRLESTQQRLAVAITGVVVLAPVAAMLEYAREDALLLCVAVTVLWVVSLWVYPQIIARIWGVEARADVEPEIE